MNEMLSCYMYVFPSSGLAVVAFLPGHRLCFWGLEDGQARWRMQQQNNHNYCLLHAFAHQLTVLQLLDMEIA